MEPVPDGLSANGMCVFVTSQRESTFHHLILLLQMFLSLLPFSKGGMLSSRWRCLRWISCCCSWRSWVAPAATRRRTRQLQSALPAWLIRERRVSLSVHSSLFLSNMRTKLCHLTAAVTVSSSGDSLDSLIQSTMKRVYSVLDSESSSVRTQAFTLMIWVRVMLFSRGSLYDCQNVWTDN